MLHLFLQFISRKARVMEDKVSSYRHGRLIIVGDYIPEDVFGPSEINVHSRVAAMKENQLSVGKRLSSAASTAHDKYVYYRQLAIQEELAREAARREQERRKQEAAKKK